LSFAQIAAADSPLPVSPDGSGAGEANVKPDTNNINESYGMTQD